jgi:hypothetical protein
MLRFGIPDNEMKQNELVPEHKEEPVYIERKAKITTMPILGISRKSSIAHGYLRKRQ